jgi:hypothetical protein
MAQATAAFQGFAAVEMRLIFQFLCESLPG